MIPNEVYRRGRGRRRGSAAPKALVSATYQSAASVRLTFDRAVLIGEIDVSAVGVSDGVTTGTLYQGHGSATLLSPRTVEVPLMGVGMAGGGVTLTAGNGTNVVAADDGGMWPGAAELPLPFG
jgi:hypothetical protein